MCENCEKDIPAGKEYIVFEGDTFCSSCYSRREVVFYTIDGELLANEEDGVRTFVK